MVAAAMFDGKGFFASLVLNVVPIDVMG